MNEDPSARGDASEHQSIQSSPSTETCSTPAGEGTTGLDGPIDTRVKDPANGIPRRVFGMLKFERGIFQRIATDPRATVQGLVVYAVTNILPMVLWLLRPAAAEEVYSGLESMAKVGLESPDQALARIASLRELGPLVLLTLLFAAGLLLTLYRITVPAGITKCLVGPSAGGAPGTGTGCVYISTSAVPAR